jgi:hypothetical protein
LLTAYTPSGGGGVMVPGAGTNSTIRCGLSNTASGYASFAIGTSSTSSGAVSFVAGQSNNNAGSQSTISGGYCNTISSAYQGFIGAGQSNLICNFPYYSSIVGGFSNTLGGAYQITAGFIGGGQSNKICTRAGVYGGMFPFIGGGAGNTVSSYCDGSILGGRNNSVSHDRSSIIGSCLTSGAACTSYANAFSKTSGTFRINHPDPSKTDTKYLQHSFVESPTRGDNIYRYKVTTCNCQASLALPDYYKFLNENDQVWVSPVCHFGSAYGVVEPSQSCVTFTSNCDGDYNVLVIGTRKDIDAKGGWLGVEIWK